MSPYSTKNNSSDKEKCIRSEFYNLFKNSPIPENELLSNLGLWTPTGKPYQEYFL